MISLGPSPNSPQVIMAKFEKNFFMDGNVCSPDLHPNQNKYYYNAYFPRKTHCSKQSRINEPLEIQKLKKSTQAGRS